MSAFLCPTCSSNTSVVETRAHATGGLRRRRRCIRRECGVQITTLEVIAPTGRNHSNATLVVVDHVRAAVFRKALRDLDALLGGEA